MKLNKMITKVYSKNISICDQCKYFKVVDNGESFKCTIVKWHGGDLYHFLDKEPPKGCPYTLEHVIANGEMQKQC